MSGRNIVRSSQLSLSQYDSDKVSLGYLERYDPVLEPWVDKKIVLLELGINKGWFAVDVAGLFPYEHDCRHRYKTSEGLSAYRTNSHV